MNYTGYSFEGKPLARLSTGCMRFPGRESATEVIYAGVNNDVCYLDTSPGYCYRSEDENCETWVGEAISGLREHVVLSAKCSPGNGGIEIGQYDPAHGFSITTSDQVRKEIEQSLKRLKVERLDFYQMWAVHSPLIYEEAFKPGGWIDGALKAKEEGLFGHLGITGHGNAAEIKKWIDSGLFEMITIPFNLLDISRLEVIKYAHKKGIAVMAMNPLAGGLLGSPSSVLAEGMADMDVTSASDLALRFCTSIEGVSALSGMTSAGEVIKNAASVSKIPWNEEQGRSARQRFTNMSGKADDVCTGCGYCMPCERELNIPEILRLRNFYLLLGMESAKNTFKERYKWRDNSYRADLCAACGKCERKCPNGIPVSRLMKEIMEMFIDL